ncbi:hypothetical protein BMETH_2373_0 [methanotrophic bacterial endosymbiont of Bathymodiolus sp.]|nr:hypothetical protein BMETH_2373_0 [methanotrophic bacterial endosymbiont of Bathymodiolus sp.]
MITTAVFSVIYVSAPARKKIIKMSLLSAAVALISA